jgi:hypothetical protein
MISQNIRTDEKEYVMHGANLKGLVEVLHRKENKKEMPEAVGKAEKKEKLVMKREKEKRVEAAEAKGKSKPSALMK